MLYDPISSGLARTIACRENFRLGLVASASRRGYRGHLGLPEHLAWIEHTRYSQNWPSPAEIEHLQIAPYIWEIKTRKVPYPPAKTSTNPAQGRCALGLPARQGYSRCALDGLPSSPAHL